MLIGHKAIIESLKRLASAGNLGHAYLFHGPSMVGKRLVAESFANYLESGEFAAAGPRGSAGPIGSINPIGLDGLLVGPAGEQQKIGIDAVRELQSFLSKRPAKSFRRTAIVDQAEKMTAEAQNAMLRIAEEPPPSTLIILVASDAEAILETLLSRLAKIYFSLVPVAGIIMWLESDLGFKKGEAEKLARGSLGKPGLAWAMHRNEKLRELLKSAEEFLKTPPAKLRDFIKKLIEPEDFNLPEFLDALILLAATTWSHRPDRVGTMTKSWHRLLELRGRSANFALNPRLQLEALTSSP